MISTQHTASHGWYTELLSRFIKLWFFKAAGTTLFMALFFYIYFELLHYPRAVVTKMPATWVDDWVVFWPPAFYVYVSLWLYTALAPALQPNFARLVVYGFGIGAVCAAGLLIFWIFPTAVPFDASAPWLQDSTTSILRKIDLSGNAFPSLHVATAMFTGMSLHAIIREARCPRALLVLNWVWCALIVYSTLAIKQHVMCDVLAGVLLGAIFGIAYLSIEKRFFVNSV
jgi:membrane-associated phospholipid phosphatase